MDPVEKMLIEKYKISPAQAKVYAERIKNGSAPDDGDLKKEAYNDVANKETMRLRQLQMKMEKYAELSKRKNSSYPNLSASDEAFYQSVRKHHDESIRTKAAAAFTQAKSSTPSEGSPNPRAEQQKQQAIELARKLQIAQSRGEKLPPNGEQFMDSTSKAYGDGAIHMPPEHIKTEPYYVQQARAGGYAIPADGPATREEALAEEALDPDQPPPPAVLARQQQAGNMSSWMGTMTQQGGAGAAQGAGGGPMPGQPGYMNVEIGQPTVTPAMTIGNAQNFSTPPPAMTIGNAQNFSTPGQVDPKVQAILLQMLAQRQGQR